MRMDVDDDYDDNGDEDEDNSDDDDDNDDYYHEDNEMLWQKWCEGESGTHVCLLIIGNKWDSTTLHLGMIMMMIMSIFC